MDKSTQRETIESLKDANRLSEMNRTIQMRRTCRTLIRIGLVLATASFGTLIAGIWMGVTPAIVSGSIGIPVLLVATGVAGYCATHYDDQFSKWSR